MKTSKYIQKFLGMALLSLSCTIVGIPADVSGETGAQYRSQVYQQHIQQLAKSKEECAQKVCPVGQKPLFVATEVKCICVQEQEPS